MDIATVNRIMEEALGRIKRRRRERHGATPRYERFVDTGRRDGRQPEAALYEREPGAPGLSGQKRRFLGKCTAEAGLAVGLAVVRRHF